VRFYATNVDPRLPANLAPMVQAIFGLDDYPTLRPMHPPIRSGGANAQGRAAPDLAASAPVPGAYTPGNIVTAYNLQPLYNQGRNGSGQTIGVIGCDAYNPSDIQQFDALFGLPQRTINAFPVDGGADGSDPETTLDLEWSGAIAPGAAIAFYGFPSDPISGGCPFFGFFDAVSRVVSDDVAGVVSISLGACESMYNDAGILQALENEFSAASLAGQSVLAASGDAGAYCDTPGGTLAPSYPASSAYVTAVGGTTLFLNADSSYEAESAWGGSSECNGSPCGSGGGISRSIPEPSWQTSDAVNSNGRRGVPDVALDADPATGYVIYFSALGGPVGGVGGTSVATPEWAGIVALADQGAGRRLGLLGPLLYGSTVLRARSSTSPPYHDVTTGNNLTYSAAPGWDFTTGWGSPNAARLVSLISSSCVPGAASASASSVSLQAAHRVFLPIVVNGSCASG
jgi:kumamolisin